ncbi:MAG: imidazole glycerol phosphate synthase subunit HisH [Planctomycetota bacterium]
MIAIIDYETGNLHSVRRGLEKAGGTVSVTADPAAVAAADAIVLPGVGAFARGMANLDRTGLIPLIKQQVAAGIPFLGICLGMQLLFDESDEDGLHKGLGLLPGRVVRFNAGLKVPQMGWNQVAQTRPDPLWSGIPDRSYFYFVHSYYCAPTRPADTLGRTGYGVDFTAVAGAGNVFGTQFHPEKSQALGIRMLANFIKLASGNHSGATSHA